MGLLSWLGWTVLGGLSINLLIGLVWYAGWELGLLAEPDPESVAFLSLQWVQVLAAPLIGNTVIRRLVHGGSWIGWTLLGWWSISSLAGLLWLSAWTLGLVGRPADDDYAAVARLQWVYFVAAPLIGIVIRRFVRPDRRHLSRTVA